MKDETSVAVQKVKDEAEIKFKTKEEEIRKLKEAKDLEISILKISNKNLESEKEALDKQIKYCKKEEINDKKEITIIYLQKPTI